MSLTPVTGTNSGETLSALSGNGTDYKYDAKGGNDFIRASTGDDILIGGSGSDVLFGGLGSDTFQFGKNAEAGDKDYITDFKFESDNLSLVGAVTIVGATAGHYDTTFNGINLANDAKVWDLKLTLLIVDDVRTFNQEVYLMDIVKNQKWSADQVNDYLHTLGYEGNVVFELPS